MAIMLTIIVNVTAIILTWYLTKLLRGRNVSDLGVRMYEHNQLALTVGIGAVLLLSILSFVFVKRYVATGSSGIESAIILIYAICLVPYCLFLFWIYG